MAAHVKFFPCVNTAQTAVAAATELHTQLQNPTADIQRIEMIMADYPMVKRQQDDEQRRRPHSREAADHSFPFLVAVALIDGALTLDQFANERWKDPAVIALMEKISMRRDRAWFARAPGALPCTLHVTTQNGSEYTAKSVHPPEVAAGNVVAKFHDLLADVASHERRSRIVDAVMELHHSSSTATLDAALSNGEFS